MLCEFVKIILSVYSMVIATNLFNAFFRTNHFEIFCEHLKKKNYRAVQEAIPICVIEAKHN